MIVVRAFSRIHLGLIDLGSATRRRYGGAGIVVGSPVVEVIAEPGTGIRTGFEKLDQLGHQSIAAAIARIPGLDQQKFNVHLRRVPPQHVGLGTKTTLTLSVLRALSSVAGIAADQEELQSWSGRGGASGIGVNAFFQGGFIVDGGHPRTDVPYRPSSGVEPATVPPIICRCDFPEEWVINLILPEGINYAGGAELSFFERNTPIDSGEVLATLASVYHAVAPGITTKDFSLFREGVLEMMAGGFKRREIEGQTANVRGLLQELQRSAEVAAGMSSMGPLLFAITPDGGCVANRQIMQICDSWNAVLFGQTNGRNGGHEWQAHD
jgi:beta-ribofuranosylaminobenzene 5'-phosphate synthase